MHQLAGVRCRSPQATGFVPSQVVDFCDGRTRTLYAVNESR